VGPPAAKNTRKATARNNGAINLDLFCDSNPEHIGVFAKIEPLLGEIPEVFGAQFAASFEKLIDAAPDGRKRVAQARERLKAIRSAVGTAAIRCFNWKSI